MARYRQNSKIKREHGMIPKLEAYLESIEHWEDIQSILTGAITRRKGTSPFEFTVQYETDTGIKCLAKYQGAVQEVFLVTNQAAEVKKRINAAQYRPEK